MKHTSTLSNVFILLLAVTTFTTCNISDKPIAPEDAKSGSQGLSAKKSSTNLSESPNPFITGGAIDNVHRNVGAMAVEFEPGIKTFLCSGSLIADTVFLTAAHCLNFLPSDGISANQVYVTFDVNVESASSFVQAKAYQFIPGGWHDLADPLDLGVIILSQKVTAWGGQSLSTVKLATEGLLDQRASRGGLRGKNFLNVGYGLSAEFKKGPPRYSYDGYRKVSASPFQALLPAWLVLLMNSDATGEGGDCYGDSGSPKFIPNTDTIVAVVTWGDVPCRATTFDYRLDIPQARAFLGQFVQLP